MNDENEKSSRNEPEDAPEADAAEPEAPAEDIPAGRSSSEAGADGDALLSEIESLKQQVEANLDRALRAQAEMENLRKRTARDVENAHKFALERFVQELLPVIDSLELGMNAADSAGEADSVREGIELTLKKFRDVLEKFGVAVIDPAGERFDPELHEAVSMLEQEGSAAGTVITVMQKGYSLNGRLVRPAMVAVAR